LRCRSVSRRRSLLRFLRVIAALLRERPGNERRQRGRRRHQVVHFLQALRPYRQRAESGDQRKGDGFHEPPPGRSKLFPRNASVKNKKGDTKESKRDHFFVVRARPKPAKSSRTRSMNAFAATESSRPVRVQHATTAGGQSRIGTRTMSRARSRLTR